MTGKTMLITGFEPFGTEPTNPSWEAVNALPERIGAYRLEKRLLPVEFGRAAALAIEAADAIKADAILCVGLAAGRTAVTPEAIGINVRDARIPDGAGVQPAGEPIKVDAPAAYFSTLPMRGMVEAIQSTNIPSALSYTAGTYVCNDLLYTLLHRYRDSGVKVAFIHVPRIGEPCSLDDLVRALCAAIEAIEPEESM